LLSTPKTAAKIVKCKHYHDQCERVQTYFAVGPTYHIIVISKFKIQALLARAREIHLVPGKAYSYHLSLNPSKLHSQNVSYVLQMSCVIRKAFGKGEVEILQVIPIRFPIIKSMIILIVGF